MARAKYKIKEYKRKVFGNGKIKIPNRFELDNERYFLYYDRFDNNIYLMPESKFEEFSKDFESSINQNSMHPKERYQSRMFYRNIFPITIQGSRRMNIPKQIIEQKKIEIGDYVTITEFKETGIISIERVVLETAAQLIN